MLLGVTRKRDPQKLFADAEKLRTRADELEREATQLLRKARLAAGVTQSEIAGAMDISQARVSYIENAERVTPEVAGAYFAAVTKGGQDGKDKRSRGAREDLARARQGKGQGKERGND